MKKAILSIIFLTITTISLAQEDTANNNSNFEYQFQVKMGFAQLEINDFDPVNGNLQQLDLALSNKLGNKFKISYGFGFSEFKANALFNDTPGALKNTYLRLPVNLLYSKSFQNKTTIVTGIGVYGNYLLKSKIPGLLDEKNVGLGFGASVQTGVKFNISEDLDFGIMIESQTDFSKNKKNDSNQKITNTALLSLNFIYKI